MGNFCKRKINEIWDFDSHKKFEEMKESVKKEKIIESIKQGDIKEEENDKIKGKKEEEEENDEIKDIKEEENNEIIDIFLQKCNDFLKQIKININDIQIEILNKSYVLYQTDKIKILASATLNADIKLKKFVNPNSVKLEFKDSKVTDDKQLQKDISSISKKFKEKFGVDLEYEYPLFIKKIGNFLINGTLSIKYENNKFKYEFMIRMKKDEEDSHEIKGILRLEIIFKNKPYLIRFNSTDNSRTILLNSTILNILISSYEDKIPLILYLFETNSEKDTGNNKNIDFMKMFENVCQQDFKNFSYS